MKKEEKIPKENIAKIYIYHGIYTNVLLSKEKKRMRILVSLFYDLMSEYVGGD